MIAASIDPEMERALPVNRTGRASLFPLVQPRIDPRGPYRPLGFLPFLMARRVFMES